MKSESNIIGKNLTNSDIKQAQDILEKNKQASLKPLPGEKEKILEENQLIAKVNDYLNQEFNQLGVDLKSDILPEQVHLLDDEVYSRNFSEVGEDGFYDSKMSAIYVNKSKYNKIELLATVLHEAIHFHSASKYYFDKDKQKINNIKSGYHIGGSAKGDNEYLQMFNESIVEMLVEEIVDKHLAELARDFQLTPEELKQQLPKYFDRDASIIEMIVNKIAEENQEEVYKVWDRFKKGIFTGSMMHLREIEKVFGHGALRFIASLEMQKMPIGEYRQKLSDYFTTEAQEERERIANEIMIEGK